MTTLADPTTATAPDVVNARAEAVFLRAETYALTARQVVHALAHHLARYGDTLAVTVVDPLAAIDAVLRFDLRPQPRPAHRLGRPAAPPPTSPGSWPAPSRSPATTSAPASPRSPGEPPMTNPPTTLHRAPPTGIEDTHTRMLRRAAPRITAVGSRTSPPPAAASARSGSPARCTPSSRPPAASSPPATPPPTYPTASSTCPAETAARASARPARRPTAPTPTNSSARDSSAAKASPTP